MGRVKKCRVKKGIVLTVSILLLSFILLYLAFEISSYSVSSEYNSATMSLFESINTEYDAISTAIKRIETTESVNITFYGKNISFQKNITYNDHYQEDLTRFRQFAEAFGHLNNSIDLQDAIKPKMYIMPQNISVEYSDKNITFIPNNNQYSEDIKSYQILIKTKVGLPILNWTNIHEVQQDDPDALLFIIGIEGSDGGTSEVHYLNRTETSTLELVNTQSNATMVIINVSSPASLTIEHNLDMYLNVIIGLDTNNTILTKVVFRNDVINVSKGSIYKSGNVILGEG